jgi:hypothetical protein
MTTADTIRTTAARLIGYTVQGHGFNKQHYTLTRAEALSWAACYPAATITRAGRFVAATTKGA